MGCVISIDALVYAEIFIGIMNVNRWDLLGFVGLASNDGDCDRNVFEVC